VNPLIAFLAGSGVTLAGMAAQAMLSRVRRPRRKPARPVCGCSHHRSYHSGGTGPCQAISTYDEEPCRCQQYEGPLPLPEFYPPEIPS
jgi:hypothetical protein